MLISAGVLIWFLSAGCKALTIRELLFSSTYSYSTPFYWNPTGTINAPICLGYGPVDTCRKVDHKTSVSVDPNPPLRPLKKTHETDDDEEEQPIAKCNGGGEPSLCKGQCFPADITTSNGAITPLINESQYRYAYSATSSDPIPLQADGLDPFVKSQTFLTWNFNEQRTLGNGNVAIVKDWFRFDSTCSLPVPFDYNEFVTFEKLAGKASAVNSLYSLSTPSPNAIIPGGVRKNLLTFDASALYKPVITLKWSPGAFRGCATCEGPASAGEIISGDYVPTKGATTFFDVAQQETFIGFPLEWTTVQANSQMFIGSPFFSTEKLRTTFALFTPFLALPMVEFTKLLQAIGLRPPAHNPVPIGERLNVIPLRCSQASNLPPIIYTIDGQTQYTLRNYIFPVPYQGSDECVLAIAGHDIAPSGGNPGFIFAGTWFLHSLGVTTFGPPTVFGTSAEGSVGLGIPL